jgi:hypothetical protein
MKDHLPLEIALAEQLLDLENSHAALMKLIAKHLPGLDDAGREKLRTAASIRESRLESLEHNLEQLRGPRRRDQS